jgi:hypothetical protein
LGTAIPWKDVLSLAIIYKMAVSHYIASIVGAHICLIKMGIVSFVWKGAWNAMMIGVFNVKMDTI